MCWRVWYLRSGFRLRNSCWKRLSYKKPIVNYRASYWWYPNEEGFGRITLSGTGLNSVILESLMFSGIEHKVWRGQSHGFPKPYDLNLPPLKNPTAWEPYTTHQPFLNITASSAPGQQCDLDWNKHVEYSVPSVYLHIHRSTYVHIYRYVSTSIRTQGIRSKNACMHSWATMHSCVETKKYKIVGVKR